MKRYKIVVKATPFVEYEIDAATQVEAGDIAVRRARERFPKGQYELQVFNDGIVKHVDSTSGRNHTETGHKS